MFLNCHVSKHDNNYTYMFLATPAEVIGHYYCYLLNGLDNSVVCQIILELRILDENLIHCAKLYSDYQKNAFLLDQLLVTNKSSKIFEFSRLLHNTENQQELGYMLVNGKIYINNCLCYTTYVCVRGIFFNLAVWVNHSHH